MTYLIVSNRPWNASLPDRLQSKIGGDWKLISEKSGFTSEQIELLNPEIIFVPHWSEYIPETIYLNYPCVIFHMTDLPFGRGGSPLQNLIEAGHDSTMISALKAGKELDAGPIYLKKPLSLHGTAEEIFIRADKVIEEMIIQIVEENPKPYSQTGEVTRFKRRTPEQSEIVHEDTLGKLYDKIRMLDAEGYPNAFLDTEHFRIEFYRASRKTNKIVADVRIFKK